jgi:hypothetical protein
MIIWNLTQQGAKIMQTILLVLSGLLVTVGLFTLIVISVGWAIKVAKRIPMLHDFHIECSPRSY